MHAHRAGVSSMQNEPGASGMLPNVHWKGVDMGLLRSHAKFLALPPVHGLTLADHSSFRQAIRVLRLCTGLALPHIMAQV